MMSGNVTVYTDLITSEHADKPNFMAMVAQTIQPFADMIALYERMGALYDLDQAVGAQLDTLGEWIGISRNLGTPITGVYFGFDTAGVGFDQGVWQGPFDPSLGLVQLPDDVYYLVLKARIVNNAWNGQKASAVSLINDVLAPLGYSLFLQDPANLTMQIGLVNVGSGGILGVDTLPFQLASGEISPLVKALLTRGLFDIKPIGVHVDEYIYQSQGGPMFAFDLETANFAGFDLGGWAIFVPN